MIVKRFPLARLLRVWFTAAVLIAGGASAFAQSQAPGQAPEQAPAAFSADEMTHDKELGVITARGNVEVNQGGRTLLADTISYDQGQDLIRATGNVTLHNPTGEVLFAQTMEVSGDLKNGLIEDFRAIMADRSRFAAKHAQLVNDETLTLDRAVYSPCEPCKTDPSRPLLWQLKAVRIVHDRVNKEIQYEDAWLEFAGVPIMYTPYMTHPDPSVKRKSGLLPPSFGGGGHLGMMAKVPYFYVLDDYSDITLTPILTSMENGGVAGEYRERFTKGEIKAIASGAYDSKNNTLGHINAKSRFDIDETWRWGADVNRASTSTYMRRYGFGSESTLTSQVFMEGFNGQNYAAINAIAYQDMRTSNTSPDSPLVLPVAQYNHQGETSRFGAYNTIDMNVVSLLREQGADSKRISVKPAWNISHVAPTGDIYKLSASMGMDFFHAENLAATPVKGGVYNGAALRVNPELAFDWRWPLARRTGSVTEIIEPIGQVIASPYGGNSYKMANEDSQDFDFNDTNLFSTNRFTGYDRVETGPRSNYGLKWGVYGDQGGSTSVLVGQSYRLKKDDTFQVGTGLENNFSDYVARVQVSPGPHLNLLYRTRLDKDTLDFKRNEAGVAGIAGWFKYNVDYVFFDHQKDSEFLGRRELSYSMGAQLTDTWSANLGGVRDLTANGDQRSMNLGAIYEDECFQFDTTLSRTFYLDREIKPTDTILFRLVFKTLGEVTSDVTAN